MSTAAITPPTALRKFAIRQIAYFVHDIRTAAAEHSQLFGSGPFFVLDNIPLGRSVHRGKETTFYHSSAFGQWGSLQVEFIQQDRPGPSILHDLFPEGTHKTGLHHVASIVEDLNLAVKDFEAAGYREAFRADIPSLGIEGVFMDTVSTFGHFVELYPAVPALTGFYDMVEAAAGNFDGQDRVRLAPKM